MENTRDERVRRLWPFLAWPLVFFVLACRHPDILTNAQLTWEDGSIFLYDGLTRPWHQTWFEPFLGYFILLTKMVAGLFSPLTMIHAPLVFNLFALAAMTFALALPLFPSFAHIAPWPYRAAWVCASALMPWHTETFGNITNTHWYVFYALTLFSIADFRNSSRGVKALLPVLVFVGVFTTPNAVLIIPVLGVRLWHSRRERDWQFGIHAWSVLVIFAMAVSAKIFGVAPPRQGEVDIAGAAVFLVKGIGFKVVLQNLAGNRAANYMVGFVYYASAAGVFVALLAFLVWAGLRGRGVRAAVLGAAVYYVLAPMLLASVLRPQYILHFVVQDQYAGADRYFLVPSLYLFLLVSLALYTLPRPRVAAPVRALFAAAFIVIAAYNFTYPRTPDYTWRRYVRDYYHRLLEFHGAPGAAEFPIPTHPGDEWILKAPLFTPTDAQRREIERQLARLPGG